MQYAKPQILNVKKASVAILGGKIPPGDDRGPNTSTVTAYRSDE